jgi:DNA-binding beta-propeller fold protein YncE
MNKPVPIVCVIFLMFATRVSAQDRPPLEMIQSTPLPELGEGDFDHFAVDLAGHRLFCTAEANGKVLVFDLGTNKLIHTIGNLKLPHSLVYQRDLYRLLVIDGGLGQIKSYDANSYRAIGSVQLHEGAGPMAYDPQTKYLYVVSGGRDGHLPESYLNVVDTTAGKILAESKVRSDDVEALVLEKSGRRLFVDVRGENTIEVVDRNTLATLAKWPLGQVARKPSKMAFDEVDHRLFVGARDPAKLVVLNSDSGTLVATLPGAPMVDDMVYNKEDKRIYFAGSDFLDVFLQRDNDHYSSIGRLPTAFRAKTAILVPELDRYYVAVPRHEGQVAELRVYRVVH